jgi:hypothetical protein
MIPLTKTSKSQQAACSHLPKSFWHQDIDWAGGEAKKKRKGGGKTQRKIE